MCMCMCVCFSSGPDRSPTALPAKPTQGQTNSVCTARGEVARIECRKGRRRGGPQGGRNKTGEESAPTGAEEGERGLHNRGGRLTPSQTECFTSFLTGRSMSFPTGRLTSFQAECSTSSRTGRLTSFRTAQTQTYNHSRKMLGVSGNSVWARVAPLQSTSPRRTNAKGCRDQALCVRVRKTQQQYDKRSLRSLPRSFMCSESFGRHVHLSEHRSANNLDFVVSHCVDT